MSTFIQDMLGNVGTAITGQQYDPNNIPVGGTQDDKDKQMLKQLTIAPNTQVAVKKTVPLNDFLQQAQSLGYDAGQIHQSYVALRNQGVDIPGYEDLHTNMLNNYTQMKNIQQQKNLQQQQIQQQAQNSQFSSLNNTVSQLQDHPDTQSNIDQMLSNQSLWTQPEKDMNWGQIAGHIVTNFIPSLMNTAKGIGLSVAHPLDTLTSIGNIAGGLEQKADVGLGKAAAFAENLGGLLPEAPNTQSLQTEGLFGTNTPGQNGQPNQQQQAIQQVGQFLQNRYGTLDNFKKTLATDPTGFLTDIMSVVGGGAGLAGKVGELSKAGEVSDISKVGEVSQIPQWAQTANEVSQAANNLNPANWVVKGATLPFKGVSSVLDYAKSLVDSKVPTDVQTGLSNIGKNTYNQVLDIAKQYEGDTTKTSNLDALASRIDKSVEDNVGVPKQQVGQQLGNLRKFFEDNGGKIDPTDGINAINKSVTDAGGVIDDNGQIMPSQNKVFTMGDSEKNVFQGLYDDLNKLSTNDNTTYSQVDLAFRKSVNNYDKLSKINNTAMNPGFLKQIYGVRDALEGQFDKQIGSNYSDLRGQYSELSNVYDTLKGLVNKNSTLNPGETVLTSRNIKKLFSPDSVEVKNGFDLLKQYTGIDFAKQAVVTKWIGQLFNDSNVTNLLNNTINSIPTSKSGIIGKATDWILQKLTGNPEDIAKKFVGNYDSLPTAKQQEILSNFHKNMENFINRGKGGGYATPEDFANENPQYVQKTTEGQKATNSFNKVGTTENALLEEAKKYKSAEEFVSKYDLYHGTPYDIQGGELKFGAGEQLKKGGYMGGHFLTNEQDIANNFSFGGKVYRASGDIKDKVFDVNKNITKIKEYIGKEYTTPDGENIEFTKQDFDYMFPNGKADWATIDKDFLEYITKKEGKIGVAIPEYAGGKLGTTYQIFEDNIPIYTEQQLKDIYNKANNK